MTAKKTASKTAVKKSAAKKTALTASTSGRAYFSQTDFPLNTLQDTQRIAVGIWENFAGKGATPPDVALAIGVSPTSSSWRALCGSSIAYGLTTGGPNAEQITLTPLGRKLVAPETEGADLVARSEAILKPKIMREFFERYQRAKFPNDTICRNVLMSMSLPTERATDALAILKANGAYTGIIRDTPTGPFVMLDSPAIPAPAVTADQSATSEDGDTGRTSPLPHPPTITPSSAPSVSVNNRVFITHGKQKGILGQIKDLLTFGNFEPIVSVERETTAIPVPEKVFEDMRSCAAGVIHVNAEGEFLDKAGNSHVKINENVLIEIGAAIALFGKKVILLVEKGVTLPSNLQGLYRCEYEGDKLDYEATMKLLKTFNQFR
jgi:hypothetical protein